MSNFRKIFCNNYDKYVGKIYRFIFLKVNSQEIAEDLTSEVFLRFWRKIDSNYKIDNPQAFLYQIARNLVIDHYREKAQNQTVSTESLEYAQLVNSRDNLEEKAIMNSDLDQVKAALANIKEDYREMIVWYYLDELRVPEIAKMVNKSEEAVRVLIHRALKSLKNEIEKM